MLARNGITYSALCDSLRDGNWEQTIVVIYETLTTWKSWAVFCEVSDEILNRLLCDRQWAL
jgi:hypothetical protein